MKEILLAFFGAGMFTLPAGALAGTFSITDNFDSYATDAFITDDPNWTTTDLWQNNGVIPRSGGRAGWLGGLYDGPTTATTYLTRGFDAQDNNRFTFRWIQNIANADPDDGKRDKFGWTVKSAAGANLLTLMFDNVSLPGSNLLAKGYSGSFAGTLQSSSGLGVSNRGEWAQFEIVLDTAANSWTASLFNATANGGAGAWQTFIQNGAVDGTGYTVGGISSVWDLADKSTTRSDTLIDDTPVTLYSGAGQNIMMFDDLSISGVPEPSSLSLFTFGALAYLASRRRSHS
jgi:hypothetical protein